MDTDIILRFGNETAYWNRLKAIGHSKRDTAHFKAPTCSAFRCMGQPITGIEVDENDNEISGDVFTWQRVRLLTDDADKFPPDNNPAFAKVWDIADTTEENANPEPRIKIESVDIDDNPVFYIQTAGTF